MNKNVIILSACVVFLLAIVSPTTAGAAPHIADFRLGLTRDELGQRKVMDCGVNLCGEVDLGGVTWSGVFTLEGNALASIALSGPSNEKYMEAVTSALESSPYALQSVLTDSGAAATDQSAVLSLLRAAASEECSFVSFLFQEGEVGCLLALEPAGITLVIMSVERLNRRLNAGSGKG